LILVSQAKSTHQNFISENLSGPEPMARKIVVFKSGIDEATKEALINKVGGVKIKDLKLVKGGVNTINRSRS